MMYCLGVRDLVILYLFIIQRIQGTFLKLSTVRARCRSSLRTQVGALNPRTPEAMALALRTWTSRASLHHLGMRAFLSKKQ